MDKRQKSIAIIVFFLVFFLGCVVNGQTPLREWHSLTSHKFTQDMVLYRNHIWTATTGGLVEINPADASFHVYTNVDGLETNQLFCLHVDDKNRLWVGGKGRLINFSNPDEPDGYVFTDRDGGFIDIYDIISVPGSDSLWLANRKGLTIFLPGNGAGDGLILDTYNRFGDIDRDTPARRVAIDGDSIWVGSDGGLAVGSRNDIRQLKAPAGWVSYLPSTVDTLPNDSITGLIIVHDTVIIGTTTGAYRFNRAVPELVSLGLYGAPHVYNMSQNGDTVLIHSVRGSAMYADGSLTGLSAEGMPIGNTTCGVFDTSGVFWNGNLIGGIFFRSGNEMKPFNTGGLPSNECRRVIFAQGKLWGAFWSSGLAYYQNGIWTHVDDVIGSVTSLEVGPLGELWVGTWGEGVYRILGDSLAHFNETNSSLSGLYEAHSFVVVADIKNSGDAVWFANLRGRAGELVAVNPFNTNQWQSYVLAGGSQAEWVESIAIGQETVYIGSTSNGIYARLYNGTPFSGSDDYTWQFTSANSNIGSNIIKSLAIDRYDSLWVGTAFGLSYQALGEVIFQNETLPESFGPEVTAIGFDGQGNLYAGSNQGITVRDISTGTYEYITTANSGLVDDKVFDIYFDKDTHEFWIATAGGISRMRLPAQSSTSVENVNAYPNPFVIRFGDETVRFSFADIAKIRIFTGAGELLREIPVNGQWDGRNNSGQLVASGLYFFTIEDSDGNVGQGKIFLIRE